MIRDGKHEDIPAVIDIGQSLVSLTDRSQVNIKKAAATLRQSISSAQHCFFVAEVDGKIVGFIVGAIQDVWYNDDKVATDLGLMTRAGHEGQAVWLIRRFLRWARSKQVPTLMGVSTGAESAERTGQMYEAHGLTKVGGMYYGSLR
jgi:hypothetical protein